MSDLDPSDIDPADVPAADPDPDPAPADPLDDTPTPKNAAQPATAADASYKLLLALIQAGKVPPSATGALQTAWEVAAIYDQLLRYFATGALPRSPDELGRAADAARRARVRELAAAKLAAPEAGPTSPPRGGGAPRHAR